MTDRRSLASAHSPLGRRLWWLIAGRAMTAVLLLLIARVWKWSSQSSSSINSVHTLTLLIFAVAALTLVYSVARLTWENFLTQARLQILVDVLLVTWLVWISGNVSSPYAALYIVIISIASLFVGPRGALIT